MPPRFGHLSPLQSHTVPHTIPRLSASLFRLPELLPNPTSEQDGSTTERLHPGPFSPSFSKCSKLISSISSIFLPHFPISLTGELILHLVMSKPGTQVPSPTSLILTTIESQGFLFQPLKYFFFHSPPALPQHRPPLPFTFATKPLPHDLFSSMLQVLGAFLNSAPVISP